MNLWMHFRTKLSASFAVVLPNFIALLLTVTLAHANPLSPIQLALGLKPSISTPTTVLKHFSAPQLTPPAEFHIQTVSTPSQLERAVHQANKRGGNTAIYLTTGEYNLERTLHIQANHVWLLSGSQSPYDVLLKGQGMRATDSVGNLIRVTHSHFVLDGLTLAQSPNHLLQITAETRASHAIIRNCIFQDSYEQMIKVSYDLSNSPGHFSVNGTIEHSIFQYTQGIAPHYYTGGIDALGAKNWLVRHNIFRDIASPAKHIAQHAIHFWVNSSDNQVIENLFVDNDRAIGFGMVIRHQKPEHLKYPHQGGEILSNLIYHSANNDPYADTGIVLEASPETVIKDNWVYLEHGYPRAIEYRFAETQEVKIEGNHTNKLIVSRNKGSAKLVNNYRRLKAEPFVDELRPLLKKLNVITMYQPINKRPKQ